MLAAYNRWMNEHLYGVCAGLSDEERKRDRGAFFRSIHGTLNHLLLADRLWMARFTGTPFMVTGLDQELYSDFEALRQGHTRTDADIEAWTAGLSEAELSGRLEYTSVVSPRPGRCEMWLALTHFFNHQTHHRGQLTTLLSQCGLDSGITDLIGLPGVQS